MAFHAFAFTEFYSNASGTIQFIELVNTGGTGEHFWDNTIFQVTHEGSESHTFTVPSNLAAPTANGDRVLLATQGFANLGIVTPDFIIPDGFLFIDGANIIFRNQSGSLVADQVDYGALPADHELSLDDNGVTHSNSPTNYAGDSGHVSNSVPT